MCGACGAGSARSAIQHWSAPFLASIPARCAAARTLTRWSRSAGWAGTISGVAGGFEVATASGSRTVTADLTATVARLEAYGVDARTLLGSANTIVAGPPTRPGRRSWAGTSPPADVSTVDLQTAAASAVRRELPADPRRPFRVPGLLAWLTVAETGGLHPRLVIHLALDGTEGMTLVSGDRDTTTCESSPSPPNDVVLGGNEAPVVELVALLCPAVAPSC